MNIKWLLFSFKGCLNHQPFWTFTFSGSLIWLILSLLLGVAILHSSKYAKSLIPTLPPLWPSLAVQARCGAADWYKHIRKDFHGRYIARAKNMTRL